MPSNALTNPVALSILGALLEQPRHPYQLATALADRGVPVNRGTVYDTLEAMAREGWVEAQPAEQAGARPKRTPTRSPMTAATNWSGDWTSRSAPPGGSSPSSSARSATSACSA